MSFFETHQEGCRPNAPCARCRLYGAIFKIEQGQFRENILKLVELAFEERVVVSAEVPDNKILEIPIDSFGFSTRTRLCLTRDNILTLGDLTKQTRESLIQIPNFGKHSLKEVEDALAVKGLCLALKKT